MPDYATIFGDVCCYACQRVIDTRINIQWGRLPYQYKLKDRLRWVKIKGETVPSFLLVGDRTTWNCGETGVYEVLAFDCDSYAVEPGEQLACPKCGARIGGVFARIREDVIESIEVHSLEDVIELLGEPLGAVDTVTIDKLGNRTPRPDLFDPPLQHVESL